ncbi:hypothetical protein HanIR_Chr01g0033801 [Helianthus annuus]|nr:hypothetical protein HanIR_Chr01g0033801 [Helianthus annuus]
MSNNIGSDNDIHKYGFRTSGVQKNLDPNLKDPKNLYPKYPKIRISEIQIIRIFGFRFGY